LSLFHEMNFLLSWCHMQSSMDLVTLEEFKAESYAARASPVFRHPPNFFCLLYRRAKRPSGHLLHENM